MRLPIWLNPYTYVILAFFVLLGWVFWRGGVAPRQEVKALTETVKQTAKSNKISRSTQERIGIEGYETQRRTDERVARVQERIAADPAGGQLDADVMQQSREAWEAAIAASCRVQRTSDCKASSAAPGKH